MKIRGTRDGVVLSLDASDSAASLNDALAFNKSLLGGPIVLEINDALPWSVLQAASKAVEQEGGEIRDVRPPSVQPRPKGETVIIARTVRSGGRVESNGSVIILGDVNAGAEIVAEDDVIVVGTLRGLAHAGASGNQNAVIWAQQILAPQLRIGAALAQAGDDGKPRHQGPEVAHLVEGAIVLRPWDR
ncbi:MAG: septum site-determining protein MinC [Trueperaceae bacterium]|nr:septum site-determining protein MinC [Trueperaceae bacterium]